MDERNYRQGGLGILDSWITGRMLVVMTALYQPWLPGKWIHENASVLNAFFAKEGP